MTVLTKSVSVHDFFWVLRPEVRSQLVEQLKVLDLQLEYKTQQLQDLSDYLRRRGEIEGDYARSLERLTEKFTSKIKRLACGPNSLRCCVTTATSGCITVGLLVDCTVRCYLSSWRRLSTAKGWDKS